MKLGCLLVLVLSSSFTVSESLLNEPLASFPPFNDNDSWVSSDPDAQDLTDEQHLELRTAGVAYTFLEERLTNTGILTEVQLDDAQAVFFGIRVQASTPLSGYLLDLARDGRVSLVTLIGGNDTVLTTEDSGLDPASGPLKVCYRLTGQRLEAWIWATEGTPTEAPTIEITLPEPLTFAEGRPTVGVRTGGASFSSIDVEGETYRPQILNLAQLEPDVRFKLEWDSVTNEVYRIDSSASFFGPWKPIFWHKATSESSKIVVAAPTQSGSFRVVALSGNVLVDTGFPVRISPNASPTELTWASSEDRVYGFEWSLDLLSWQRFEEMSVEGTAGLQRTTAVLSLPESLSPSDAAGLYWRVVELSDTNSFGIVPAVAE